MNNRFRRNAARTVAVCSGLSLGLLHAAGTWAQPAAGGPRSLTFEDDQPGFIAFGEGAKVSISRDEAFVKTGNAALRFDYSIARDGFRAMLMPAGGGLANMKSLTFWIQTDHTAPIAVVLQEGEAGARYLTTFTSPKNKWQRVELEPGDFQLMEDKDSPKDPNNKLDLDQVMFVAVGDFSQFLLALAQAEGPLAGIFNIQMGPHALHIDDFTVSDQPLAMPKTEDGEIAIDLFAHPQISWIGLGGVSLNRAVNDAGDKPVPGLQIDYRQVPQKFAAALTRVGKGKLRGTGSLKMQITSERAVTLAVQLEEFGGGKYYTTLDVKAGLEPQSIELGYDNFKEGDDSNDQNHQFNPELVENVIIMDVAGILGQADNKTNVVWIGNLRAAP